MNDLLARLDKWHQDDEYQEIIDCLETLSDTQKLDYTLTCQLARAYNNIADLDKPEGKTQLVQDVHQFPGHIACDSASNSEIVVPIRAGGKIVGVLDIDSPFLGRFLPVVLMFQGLQAFSTSDICVTG